MPALAPPASLPDPRAFALAWGPRLAQDALATRVIEVLWRRHDAFADPIMDRARRDGPEIDPVIAADLESTRMHVLAHFRALLALPARAKSLGEDPMGFVRRHGVRRAQAGVPLRAVLQAYRTGHKSFWAAVCSVIGEVADDDRRGARTTMLLSDYLIDYTDLISATVTEAYMEEEAKLSEERTRLGIAVLEDLLAGAGPRTAEGWRLCEQSGLAIGRPLAVAVATRAGPAGDAATAIRERSLLARAINAALPRERLGRLIGVRDETVVAIAAAAEAPGRLLVAALREAAGELARAAPDMRIGVGLDVASLGEIPRAHHEALAAVQLSDSAQHVSCLAEISVDAYLRGVADETARRLSPSIPRELVDGALGRTLEAFADADLNIKACARALGVHNNTIYHRLNRIRRLTGLDPRTFRGLSALMTGLTISGRGAAETWVGRL